MAHGATSKKVRRGERGLIQMKILLLLLLLCGCSFVEKLESVGEVAKDAGEVIGGVLPPPWGTIIGGAVTGAGSVLIAAGRVRARLIARNENLIREKGLVEAVLDSAIKGVEVVKSKEVKDAIKNEARKRDVSDLLERCVVKNTGNMKNHLS
jgi:hypothetical protein